MNYRHRISTIYSKELVDILRDRRTLIAMIIVPIVLYPLLMLGSIQAVSYQVDALEEETLIIGVMGIEPNGERMSGDRVAKHLSILLEQDQNEIERQREDLDPDSPEAESLPRPVEHVRMIAFKSEEAMRQSIRERDIQAGVITPELNYAFDRQNKVQILADLEEMRSANAYRRLSDFFERTSERKVGQRLRRVGLPAAFVEPIVVRVVDLSSPPSILGQILPLILILMTITGAIYPAIDLTAGERERGTLESLMVCPVPVIDLIVGKFLVVTTVAIMGAALNLASVSATVYFGGFNRMISAGGEGVPFGTMALILLCLIPFAVLMSAIMIAVCSYARTFKEAQNYVTPVILAVLIPGGIAALPATRMEGVMLVMPVGNMVLLARDLLLGANVPLWKVATILLSTTMYAGAAVAVAATIFGKESVVFSDTASLKTIFTRALIKPSRRPSVAMSLLFVALLFPAWFFVQSGMSSAENADARSLLFASAWLMPLLFVALPVVMMLYWKIDVANALSLRRPGGRHLFAAALIGLSAWVLAHEVSVLQQRLLGAPQAIVESAELFEQSLKAMPFALALLFIAVIPAVSEELLFRGFLLSGLRSSARKWTAIIVTAVVFAVFHFFFFRFAVTAVLGVVLAYLCWQSRSVVPAIVTHFLHNGVGATLIYYPQVSQWIGMGDATEEAAAWSHLPVAPLMVGCAAFLIGLFITVRPMPPRRGEPIPVPLGG